MSVTSCCASTCHQGTLALHAAAQMLAIDLLLHAACYVQCMLVQQHYVLQVKHAANYCESNG
jgi:hypothetical protein